MDVAVIPIYIPSRDARRRMFSPLTMLALFLASTAMAAPNEGQPAKTLDHRIAIDRTLPQYRELNAIGLISERPGMPAATGFLVSRCAVLTNYHVVAFNDDRLIKIGGLAYFSVGQSKDNEAAFAHPDILGKVVAYGASSKNVYDVNHTDKGAEEDWAVIKLARPIGDQVGWIPLNQMDPSIMPKWPIVTAGFPGDLNFAQHNSSMSKMFGDVNCHMAGLAIYGWETSTCQISAGDSGSPAIATSPVDGIGYAIAMAEGAFPDYHMQTYHTEGIDDFNAFVVFSSAAPGDPPSEGDKILAAINAIKCN